MISPFARRILFVFALFLPITGYAQQTLSLDGTLIQGGFAKGTVPPGSQVRYDDHDVIVGPDGRFLIGFHRDEPADTVLTVVLPDGTEQRYPMNIQSREYDVQRLDGLPEEKVTPPQEVLDRIAAEAAKVRAARAQNSPETWYDSGWIWPARGPITGVFGSQRILNGEPRQPHYGVDVAAPEGSPVVAPADGVVTLVEPDLYFSGGTLMIDHGRGLASTFLHLKSISVALGQQVKQGDEIGTVGATGRATGPHLDWRINWFDNRLDATLFVGPMPKDF
ncbi:M23 family metallopeptidase [Hwanghaeella sp. LZ110]|uniref:M23 family metallopeptidase n=1 Tax=Hwanghaeella sp. LZ110 TaxID=3402810 RepID=UPI003B67B0C6